MLLAGIACEEHAVGNAEQAQVRHAVGLKRGSFQSEWLTSMIESEIDGCPVMKHAGRHAIKDVRCRYVDVARAELRKAARLARIPIENGYIERQIAAERMDKRSQSRPTAPGSDQ